MPSSGMWRRVELLLTDVSEKRIASIVSQTAATCSHCFLARGFFYHEDEGHTFLRNVG
jgi:hypothetical protein